MMPKGTPPSTSARATYEIVVHGDLSDRFSSAFLSEILESTVDRASVDGGESTAIVIKVLDQAHLLATLRRLGELSLAIERVNPVHETHRSTR